MTPYEFTRASGFFEEEGLSVELVYARGGNAAMQAMVGGAVDYAATAFDVAVQAFANGADIRRFATTGRLPLFALAVAPGEVDAIASLTDLQGKTVGVSALGNADHTLLLYLLTEAGADVSSVSFAVLGPNLFEALRRGQVAAGMVQEPALTLIVENGGKVLFNAMETADTERLLGGPYEFMGIAYRGEEREERLDQMRRLARALERGLQAQRTAPIPEIRESLPSELLVGGDGERFDEIIARYRDSLYPESVVIDVEACQRVVDALPDRRRAHRRHRPRRAARHRGRDRVTSSPAQPLPAPPDAAAPERAPGAAVVRVRDLRMRYGDAEPVVDGVALDVAEGQVVSLIGPSGSGKSTVLRAIAGLHRPDGGTVELMVDRRETGFLFQDDALLPWRTARQNVALGLKLRGAAAGRGAEGSRRLAGAARARGVRGPLSRGSSPAASASAWRSRRCWRCGRSSC